MTSAYEGTSNPATGDLDLADRQALRRVGGLSTELHDVGEVEYRSLRLERVVLIGVWSDGDAAAAESSLRELARLAETAGSQVLEALTQRKPRPDPATYVGAGKAAELRDIVTETGADTVICDGELGPGQLRRLEELVKVKVIDRTALILDIFAQHARSREGKAQVELAQLQYLLPRLRGWGEAMSRTGGGIGTRMGSGETKIETDRRRIRARMSRLRRDLAAMATSREIKRGLRRGREIPSVAIAGYTNAGKSSVLNRLTNAGALVEDELFATLDPTVRRARTPGGREYTLTDTVGFVQHLPHQLVEAFRSTLEEVAEADLILHVVDGSDPQPEQQVAAVREVLAGVGAQDIPEIVVINKTDAVDELALARVRGLESNSVAVSARTGDGVDELVAAIEHDLPSAGQEIRVLIPYQRGDLVARVHDHGEVLERDHTPGGTALHARVPPDIAAALAPFATAELKPTTAGGGS